MRHATLLVSFFAAATVTAGCATPGPRQPVLTADDLRITDFPYNADIHGEDLPVEIARFDAPALHSQPNDGRTIELGFLRYPAVEGVDGLPIVFLLDEVAGDAIPQDLVVPLRQLGDVILFDRRGYGFSSPPPPCPARLNYPMNQPLIQEKLSERTCIYARSCLTELSKSGLTVELFTERQVISDLHLLTHVLETNAIHLIAFSEATKAAQAFARHSPETVARLVLIEPPDRTPEVETQHHEIAALDTLANELSHEPLTVSFTGRSEQPIPLVLGELDLAFLATKRFRDRNTGKEDLENAAHLAIGGTNADLAEMALDMRQALGQIDSIRLLKASPSDFCSPMVSTQTTSARDYAANWPTTGPDRSHGDTNPQRAHVMDSPGPNVDKVMVIHQTTEDEVSATHVGIIEFLRQD